VTVCVDENAVIFSDDGIFFCRREFSNARHSLNVCP